MTSLRTVFTDVKISKCPTLSDALGQVPPNKPPVVRCGCTTRPPPLARERKQARMRRVLKLQEIFIFHWMGADKVRAVGPGLLGSTEQTPDAPPIWPPSPSIRTSTRACPARKSTAVSPWAETNLALMLSVVATLLKELPAGFWIDAMRSVQLYRKVSSAPCNGQRRSRAFVASALVQ